LPNGLILVSGRNSHGKSTILEGILFAFFGPKIFTGRNAESFITYGENKAELRIYFILDNKNYYIYRKWGRTGSTSSKLFELDKNRIFREIKKFNIEKFFEISKEQALSTVFVRQGEVEELANIKGAKLREMIIDLFRLNIIDEALKSLDKDLKLITYEKEKLERTRVPIERIEEDIKRIEQENNNNERIITEKDKIMREYESKLKTYPSNEIISNLENLYKNKEITEEKYKSYKNDFETKIKNTDLNLEDFTSLEKIKNKVNTLDTLKREIDVKKEDLEKKKQAIVRGMGKTKGRIEDISKKKNIMEKSLKFTKSKTALCPTCQSELTKEHYNKIIQNFNKEIEINQKKIEDISHLINNYNKDSEKYQTDLEKIYKEIIILQNLKSDFQNYQKYNIELKKIQKELKDFLKKNKNKFEDTSLNRIKTISLQVEKLTTELKSIKKEIKEKKENIKNNQNRIIELHNEIKRMKELEKKIGEIEIDVEHINKAKEYVRRFVTEYMVVKRLVKNIALKTEKYIKNFTAGQYGELILDLKGTKKTGLSLKIKDHFNGVHESIEVLSGGDRTALGMALRLAISELMSVIRPTKSSPKKNPKINFLLLDEPLAALDAIRREQILKYLTRSKSFSQIFLITHTAIPPDIQTHKILVEKDHSTGISHAKFEKLILFS
ncbi:MAG: ATP-binding protein, partial [Promethearchaeota archaeon]